MKFFILVTNGRSGSDFFHSLLDNHPEISSFPGHINLKKLKKQYEYNKSEKFIKFFTKQYSYFFNSKINKKENHHRLGVKKNKHYTVNKKKFIDKFLKLNEKKREFEFAIQNLHLAYTFSIKKNYKNIKVIFIHLHHFKNLIKFKIFKCAFFYTYRHPLSILNSGINAFFRNGTTQFTAFTLNFYLTRLIKEPFFLTNQYKIYLINLEKLHKNSDILIKKVCSIMNIKFNKILLKSTFLGKLWWGDTFSKNLKTGFNKNFVEKINLINFYDKDLSIIQNILLKPMKKLKYKIIPCTKKITFLAYLLPLKVEIFFLKTIIKNLNFKDILFFPIFYFHRVFIFCYYKINGKIINKNIKIL